MATERASSKIFRTRPWLKGLALVPALGAPIAAAYFRYTDGVSTRFIVSTLVAATAAYAFANTLYASVQLLEDSLVVTSGLRKRRYARSELESVTWEAGSGVAIRTTAGSWLKLPELGHNSQALANSVRAWLKRTAAAK